MTKQQPRFWPAEHLATLPHYGAQGLWGSVLVETTQRWDRWEDAREAARELNENPHRYEVEVVG